MGKSATQRKKTREYANTPHSVVTRHRVRAKDSQSQIRSTRVLWCSSTRSMGVILWGASPLWFVPFLGLGIILLAVNAAADHLLTG